MIELILSTLKLVGLLGVVLMILVSVNTVTGTISNVWSGKEEFSSRKLLKGIVKALIFYLCAAFMSIAFTMLPFINNMIENCFGVILLSNELLNTLSSVGVLGIVCSTIVVQAKKALQGITALSNLGSTIEDEEKIT